MVASNRRLLIHHGIYRRYPLARVPALKNARRIARALTGHAETRQRQGPCLVVTLKATVAWAEPSLPAMSRIIKLLIAEFILHQLLHPSF
jgi:hypothetical protein